MSSWNWRRNDKSLGWFITELALFSSAPMRHSTSRRCSSAARPSGFEEIVISRDFHWSRDQNPFDNAKYWRKIKKLQWGLARSFAIYNDIRPFAFVTNPHHLRLALTVRFSFSFFSFLCQLVLLWNFKRFFAPRQDVPPDITRNRRPWYWLHWLYWLYYWLYGKYSMDMHVVQV